MSKIADLRQRIDNLDDQIVGLLEARSDLVGEIKAEKKKENLELYSAAREEEIIQRVVKLAAGGSFPPDAIENIFRAIIKATRD